MFGSLDAMLHNLDFPSRQFKSNSAKIYILLALNHAFLIAIYYIKHPYEAFNKATLT